jgi:hypothetical protein
MGEKLHLYEVVLTTVELHGSKGVFKVPKRCLDAPTELIHILHLADWKMNLELVFPNVG